MKTLLTLIALFGWCVLPTDGKVRQENGDCRPGHCGIPDETDVQFINRIIEQPGTTLTFPCSEITRRDFFAGQALAGLIAQDTDGTTRFVEYNVKTAFEYADSMEAQRNK